MSATGPSRLWNARASCFALSVPGERVYQQWSCMRVEQASARAPVPYYGGPAKWAPKQLGKLWGAVGAEAVSDDELRQKARARLPNLPLTCVQRWELSVQTSLDV